jgi:hypothetical protein
LYVSIALGLLVWLLWRRLGRRSAVHPATGFRTELERRVDALKLRAPDEELEALARRLSAQRHPLAEPVEVAVRRYLEARFGGRPISNAQRRALLDALG